MPVAGWLVLAKKNDAQGTDWLAIGLASGSSHSRCRWRASLWTECGLPATFLSGPPAQSSLGQRPPIDPATIAGHSSAIEGEVFSSVNAPPLTSALICYRRFSTRSTPQFCCSADPLRRIARPHAVQSLFYTSLMNSRRQRYWRWSSRRGLVDWRRNCNRALTMVLSCSSSPERCPLPSSSMHLDHHGTGPYTLSQDVAKRFFRHSGKISFSTARDARFSTRQCKAARLQLASCA